MSKCKICHRKEATVPDRNKPWSRKKVICTDCHSDRLRGDMKKIIVRHKEKQKFPGETP